MDKNNKHIAATIGTNVAVFDPKKQYEITIPPGTFGVATGLLHHTGLLHFDSGATFPSLNKYYSLMGYSTTNDTFIFQAPDNNIAAYTVRIHGQDASSRPGIKGSIEEQSAKQSDGYYILLERTSVHGKKELVSSIKLPDAFFKDHPERLNGELADFSKLIQIKTADGKPHAIETPEFTKESGPLTDPNVMIAYGSGNLLVTPDIYEALLAFKAATKAPTEEAANKAITNVLNNAAINAKKRGGRAALE